MVISPDSGANAASPAANKANTGPNNCNLPLSPPTPSEAYLSQFQGLGSFCHSPSPPSTIVTIYILPCLFFSVKWHVRYCVSNGKQKRTNPLGQGCSLIPMTLNILSHVAASSNFASYKSKNIFNVKKLAILHNCSHLCLQFHLNSILLPQML